jgi:hypothetical protein
MRCGFSWGAHSSLFITGCLPRASTGEAGGSDLVVFHAGLDENGKRLAGGSDLGQLCCVGHLGALSWELNKPNIVVNSHKCNEKLNHNVKEISARSAACALKSLISATNRISEDTKVADEFNSRMGSKIMNTNVKKIEIERASTQEISSGFFIQEIIRNLNEARKYAEMHTDPELLYFISMARQCANEKILLSIYERN